MRLRTIALVAALAGGLAAPASAMTLTKPAGVVELPALHQIDYKKDKYRHKRHKYRAGHRYDKAPKNWHRFNKRPRDWEHRGCITVGPLWWCP